MPDGTGRFHCKGKDLLHFMGCSTFSQYTVVHKYSVVAIQEKAPLDKACLLGCGLTTGYGAAYVSIPLASVDPESDWTRDPRYSTKTANVQEGDNVAIFGLGAVGLAVIQGCRVRKVGKIIAVDTNPSKEEWARKMGATDFVNPAKDLKEGQSIVDKLVEMTDGGCDHTL